MINIFIQTCSPSTKYIFSEKNDHNKLENPCLYNLYIVQLSLWYMLFDNVLGILKKMLCMSYLKNWKLDLAAKGRRTCCPIRCCLEYQKLTLALSKFVKLTIFIYKYFAKVSDKNQIQGTVYYQIFNKISIYIDKDNLSLLSDASTWYIENNYILFSPYVIGKGTSYIFFHLSVSLDLPSYIDITFVWKHCWKEYSMHLILLYML